MVHIDKGGIVAVGMNGPSRHDMEVSWRAKACDWRVICLTTVRKVVLFPDS